MRNLFISLFRDKEPHRRAELEYCLDKNRGVFDRVFVLTEHNNLLVLFDEHVNNVIELPVTTRPTFKTYFKAVNHCTDQDDVNVVANSDIYFDKTLLVVDSIRYDQCYALTRYEHSTGQFLNRIDSQDAWVFRGQINYSGGMYCDFHLGVPGCDNRIAWELSRLGYNVSNPSLSIKSYHVHSQPTNHTGDKVVQPPYMKIEPTTL